MNKTPKQCWMCDNAATTGEHVNKKTDVIKMFGSGTFKNVVKHDYDNGTKKKIQGSDSQLLKYSKNLCATCNNQRTQPYDFAYTQFAAYVHNNFDELKKSLFINTNNIFGKRATKKQRCNLFLYFVKAFGCQLHDRGLPVPQVLREAMFGKNYDNTFRISICLDQMKTQFIQNFPLEGDQINGHPEDFFWAQNNGFFTVVYAYNRSIPAKFGEEWHGKTPQFKLGMWPNIPD